MCLAPPARVVGLGPEGLATVERNGQRFTVALHLLDEPIGVGDYLAIQARRFAVTRLSENEAHAAMALYERIIEQLERPPEPSSTG